MDSEGLGIGGSGFGKKGEEKRALSRRGEREVHGAEEWAGVRVFSSFSAFFPEARPEPGPIPEPPLSSPSLLSTSTSCESPLPNRTG